MEVSFETIAPRVPVFTDLPSVSKTEYIVGRVSAFTKLPYVDRPDYIIERVPDLAKIPYAMKPNGPFIESSPELFKRLNESEEKIAISAKYSDGKNLLLAVGVIQRGRLNRCLFLSVLRDIPDQAAFWEKLNGFAETTKISQLIIEIIAGCDETIDVAGLPRASEFLKSDLFLVDVLAQDVKFSSNHRRNIKKAKKLGIELIEQPIDPAIEDHFRLRQSSFDRRAARGENIVESYPMRYISTGKARLWQCGLDGEVLSSNLIVHGLDGAWHYESAGTSPEGFKMGASHFLHNEIMIAMRDAGVRWYDLGGTSEDNPGLTRFKEGFANHRWKKVELTYDLTPAWLGQLYAMRSVGTKVAALANGLLLAFVS